MSDLLAQDSGILLSHQPELLHSEQPSGTTALQITAAWENIPMQFTPPQPLLVVALQTPSALSQLWMLLEALAGMLLLLPARGLGSEGQCQDLQFHQ